MGTQSILTVHNLTKIYQNGKQMLTVLKEVSFSLNEGSSCAIVGPSGSGKSTLLGLCAGLDYPSSGAVILNGIELGSVGEEELAQIRNQYVGFVFQTFQLIPTLTALENVMVPIELRGEPQAKRQAITLLEKVGLENRIHHYPAQLSGGEQQRVAMARAFINKPKILFADEPTGNLDEENEKIVLDIFQKLHAQNRTIIMVTHNPSLGQYTDRIIRLQHGKYIGEEVLDVA